MEQKEYSTVGWCASYHNHQPQSSVLLYRSVLCVLRSRRATGSEGRGRRCRDVASSAACQPATATTYPPLAEPHTRRQDGHKIGSVDLQGDDLGSRLEALERHRAFATVNSPWAARPCMVTHQTSVGISSSATMLPYERVFPLSRLSKDQLNRRCDGVRT